MTASAGSLLMKELVALLDGMPEEQRRELAAVVEEGTKELEWVPNPGPQTQAMESEADELFYGGQAGGGKSDLALGLALTRHQRSLVLRRINDDARSLAERLCEMLRTTKGYNSQLIRYRDERRAVDFGGCQNERDKQRYKGRPHDLIVFDEITDFLETQYTFIIGWNRSSDPKQRVRVLCTGNPPTEPEGLWVIRYWGAWLDPKHPNPAKPGELRWYTTNSDGTELEVDGKGPHLIDGKEVYARSRTFIPAELDDNPNLTQTDDYRAALDALPANYRAAYRDGSFTASLEDKHRQLIPTSWVLAARERWTDRPVPGVPQCAIGVDVAQGGGDSNVISVRHDGWFAPLKVVPGSMTGLGQSIATDVFMVRRDGAPVVIDCGGGYGTDAYTILTENGVEVIPYKGASGSTTKTKDGFLGFLNKRAEVLWRFKEALDPEQPFGSPIALPPDDNILLGDLTALTFKVQRGGIQICDDDTLRKLLGRSIDRAMAVALAWSEGPKNITYIYQGHGNNAEHGLKRQNTMQSKTINGRRRRFS